ncbi:MAG: STAS domain-containing protein [Sphaerospermopsis sp. SIO1G2]|nr:STAS domain-containing protein [Sphaerospermopsis sp. SIO1G2]
MDIQIAHEKSSVDVRLHGEMTFADNADFKKLIDLVEENNVNSITIDFSNVTYIDSAGLGMLMILHRAAKKHNVLVTLNGVQGQVEKVLLLAKFDEYFNMNS